MGYKLTAPVRVSELCRELNLSYSGRDAFIEEVSGFQAAKDVSLTFSKEWLDSEKVCICISPSADVANNAISRIHSNSPRLDFIRALIYLSEEVGFSNFDFDSVIHPSAKIGKNVVVERGCRIGEHVVIEHNVVIERGTSIGDYSRIRAGSSIGGDGFGFERLPDGTPVRFPHLGGVYIGRYVEIGALNSVVRGTLSDTVIEDYVKTDNLVHVAHNCHIERGAFLTACSELSGGVRVGQNAWVGPNCSIIQKVHIGAGALVGIGAVVTKNIDPDSVWAGNPAKALRKNS